MSIGARAFAALLGLLALPLYLAFLGVESYGVVGLFASLQVLVAFMDFGLGTTLTRVLAGAGRDRALLAQGRDTALTFEAAYLGLAVATGLVLVLAAPWVASHWVNLDRLSTDEVAGALRLAAVSLACAWPANLYGAGLAGLHRQVPLALATGGFAVLRVSLTVALLWHRPTLESFFWAQLAASALQSAVMRLQFWNALSLPGHRAAFRWSTLRASRRFAGGMTAITITSILLVQMDKVILSYLLQLSDFGVYVIAGSLATGLYVLISPVFSVIYPRISALWSANDMAGVAGMYHTSSQAMAALIMPLAAVLACFPAQALFVLTGNAAVSEQGSWMLVFLVLGAALNGIMNMPYALQLAAGWTSLSVWTNIAAVALLAPATWWAAARYGAAGGAAAWGLLNLGYLAVTPQLLHHRILGSEKWSWYWQDVLVPAVASVSAALLLRAAIGTTLDSRWMGILQLGLCWIVVSVLTVAFLGRVRVLAARIIWR